MKDVNLNSIFKNMPDIAMCLNVECPIRENCFRFKAKPSDQQFYMNFVHSLEDPCSDYSPIDFSCPKIKREGESCTLNNNCKYPHCNVE